MNITRRQFLKLLAASATTVVVPAFSKTRDQYVFEGEVVNYVGHHPGGFIGGQIVTNINNWDGVGYPVNILNNGYHGTVEIYNDFELANFRREIPDNIWHNQTNCERYNNVHTYLREQRFGETIDQAIRKLNFVQSQNCSI